MQPTKTNKLTTIFLAAGMLAVVGFGSCNDAEEKTEEVKTDTSTIMTPPPPPTVAPDSTEIKRKMDSLKMLSDTPALKKAKLKPIVPNT